MALQSQHRKLEGKSGLFAILTTLVIMIGGIVEIAPVLSVPGGDTAASLGIDPHSPLELAGRDIYVREGCHNCHSQMVRPMRSDTLRYGSWSRSYEYVYDRPFQFGSKRIGPDLHREGAREPGLNGDTGGRNDAWHWQHLLDPRSTSAGSPMPAYGWLFDSRVDPDDVRASMEALQALGVPYTDAQISAADVAMRREGEAMVARLAEYGIAAEPDLEVMAVIAYLQSLGRNRPRFNDATGPNLGRQLYADLTCGRCHGRNAEGGIANANADPPVMTRLDDLAVRLGIAGPVQAEQVIGLLATGADLEALRQTPPFSGYDAFLEALQVQRDEIRYGRMLAPVDPAQPRPQSMPNYNGRLTARRIDAILAWLISLQPWDAASLEVAP